MLPIARLSAVALDTLKAVAKRSTFPKVRCYLSACDGSTKPARERRALSAAANALTLTNLWGAKFSPFGGFGRFDGSLWSVTNSPWQRTSDELVVAIEARGPDERL